jgi:hypothetical protein
MGFLFRRHPLWWGKYNYLLAMGIGCGVALQGLIMAFGLNMPGVYFP